MSENVPVGMSRVSNLCTLEVFIVIDHNHNSSQFHIVRALSVCTVHSKKLKDCFAFTKKIYIPNTYTTHFRFFKVKKSIKKSEISQLGQYTVTTHCFNQKYYFKSFYLWNNTIELKTGSFGSRLRL